MSRVRDLPQTTTLADDDLLYAVDYAAGPNGGRKITKADLKTAVAPTAAETKAAYESNPDTNAFTDAEKTKLAGIGAGAEFQTAAQVPYSNTSSGLPGTNVQDAIDEVNTKAQADFIPSIVSGRILHYSGGTARFDGTFYSILAGDILLNTSVTNGEVYVDLDGLVKQTASGVAAPPYTIVFAKFSTDLNNIIALTDERVKNAQNLVRGVVSDIDSIEAGDTAYEGDSGRIADAQHRHGVATGPASTQTPNQTNAEGTSTNLARADHVHNIPTAAPTTSLSPATSNSDGVGTSFARNDHTHSISTALVGDITTIQPDDSASAGTANTYARGDHKHAIVAAAPVTQNADQVNAEGSSTSFARADHVHNIPTAVAADVGSANAQGSSLSFSKADHVHKGLHSAKANAGTQRFGDISLQNGLGTTTTDDGSGNFTVDTNYGPNEFVITGTSGLNINYTGGRFRNGATGTIYTVPSGSITVSANVTLGYLYVAVNNLSNAGTVTASTTPPILGSIPFATFVSGPSTVTSTSDIRSFVNTESLTDQLRVTYPGSGLSVNYNSGAVRINGTQTTVAAGTLALSSGVSGAIYVDVDGIVKSNITGVFPPNSVPLATYTTGSSSVTALTGNRSFINDMIQFGANTDIANLNATNSAASGATNKYADAGHVHTISTGAASSISTSTTNTTGSSSNLTRADHTHAVSVINQEVTATADDNQTSLTDVLINGMTVTPAAGTYFVLFSGSIVNSANGVERTWISLYLNGVQVSATERSIGTSGGAYSPSDTHAVITTPGSQAIEARWRVAGGTSTVHSRRLTLIKLS